MRLPRLQVWLRSSRRRAGRVQQGSAVEGYRYALGGLAGLSKESCCHFCSFHFCSLKWFWYDQRMVAAVSVLLACR